MKETPRIKSISLEGNQVLFYAKTSERSKYLNLVGEVSLETLTKILAEQGYTLQKVVDPRSTQEKLIDAVFGTEGK